MAQYLEPAQEIPVVTDLVDVRNGNTGSPIDLTTLGQWLATHAADVAASEPVRPQQQILVLACDKAVTGNRIAVDRAGRPVVHYEFTPPVIESMVRATRAAARIFFAAGAVRVHAPSADPPYLERADAARVDALIQTRHFKPGKTTVSAAHLMGGWGMGASAVDSVTDAWGRVHGIPWLRVADSALFPDSLEINPYVTVMALADRVAEKILAEAGELIGAGEA